MSIGEYSFKNVKEPIALYAISNPGIQVPDRSALPFNDGKTALKSTLVLPFFNRSKDPEQDYFSDGLTEELIKSLTRLKNEKVISRTTSMLYKNTKKDIKKIGLHP